MKIRYQGQTYLRVGSSASEKKRQEKLNKLQVQLEKLYKEIDAIEKQNPASKELTAKRKLLEKIQRQMYNLAM